MWMRAGPRTQIYPQMDGERGQRYVIPVFVARGRYAYALG
jgi:hypothetical protein